MSFDLARSSTLRDREKALARLFEEGAPAQAWQLLPVLTEQEMAYARPVQDERSFGVRVRIAETFSCVAGTPKRALMPDLIARTGSRLKPHNRTVEQVDSAAARSTGGT